MVRYRLADRPSVHCVPVMDVALGRTEAEGYVKERSEKRNALSLVFGEVPQCGAATETSTSHRWSG